MALKKLFFFVFIFIFTCLESRAQVVINEGTNRNYSSIADENGEYPDWVELYNTGQDTLFLFNYSLTDDTASPAKWTLPNVKLAPGGYRTVFCSGKDRKPVSGFVNVIKTGPFNPTLGWNTHQFTTPFYWDGISNILVNTCSYSSTGYTSNSIFLQTATSFISTSYSFQDGSDASCFAAYGSRVAQRPNMKLNGHSVGNGYIQNGATDYPAPYGNWYWGARHQMLILATELDAAGLTAGNINSLGFNVIGTDPNTFYDYIDINMKLVSYSELPPEFEPVDTNNFLHTNFKISGSGETIYLYSPDGDRLSQLFVNCSDLDNSCGSFPNGSPDIFLFGEATPSATNNNSNTYSGYLLAPSFSVPSGFYDGAISVSITNPNTGESSIHYTIDGSEPSILSPIYSGEPVEIQYSVVLKARAFAWDMLPSPNTVSTFFFGVSNQTPILSVVTEISNLYGVTGIFDNWMYDWERPAYVEYFDSAQNLIFSQRSGIQIDGGWGGARANPQHSFRLELDNGVLGDGHIDYPVIPARPERTKYSRFYLRNGSNQYLVLPYKDACQVSTMSNGTNNYFSAWRPVSVYINGYYFGLYELREKFDAEYFHTLEGADPDSTDIISVSAWYGYALRAVQGSAQGYLDDYASFTLLNPADTSYWNLADNYFDLTWYTDYIIGESWMANNDWPYNNIKIYRSDKTGFRWRFCLVDMELSLLPNSWTDIYFDHIAFMLGYDPACTYINIWKKSILNERYRNYFINRFADVMNTSYKAEILSAAENSMYDKTVIEMQKEYARWGDPNNIPGQMQAFTDNHLIFNSQLTGRTEQVRNHIQANFALPNQVDLTLNVYPEGGGKIHISTITPDTYPWQGVYFNGVPVRIEAIPAEGFSFLNWGDNGLIGDTLNPVFLDTLNTDIIGFDAYFEDLFAATPDIRKASGFSIYPNPAGDMLSVRNTGDLQSDLQYQIIDVNGRILKEGTIAANSRETEIPVHAIAPSVYLLRITGSNGISDQLRFVKM
jgi:hypothetical protein